jgi:predicted nucleic acid-binding protein
VSHEIAGTYGLAAMDALHVAAALQIQADELITTEKPTKPMHRVREIQISRKRVSRRNPFSVR